MDIHAAIRSQYLAALEMLKQPLLVCPADMWNNSADHNRTWYVAYHALFFTDYYLQDTEDDFQVHAGLPDDRGDLSGAFVSQADVLGYLAFCQALVNARVPQMDLAAPSGFGRRHFDKFELQIYSIRHIQQHAGELMERIGARVPIEVDWVSVAPASPG